MNMHTLYNMNALYMHMYMCNMNMHVLYNMNVYMYIVHVQYVAVFVYSGCVWWEGENERRSHLDPSDLQDYIKKAQASMDDEYSQKKGSMQNYYGLAHTLREPVEKQPSLVVNSQLKQY